MSALEAYGVVRALRHAGRSYAPGESVRLSGRQAYYLVLSGQVRLPDQDAASPAPSSGPSSGTPSAARTMRKSKPSSDARGTSS